MFQIENLKQEISNLNEKITKGELVVAKEKELQARHASQSGAGTQVSLLSGQVSFLELAISHARVKYVYSKMIF